MGGNLGKIKLTKLAIGRVKKTGGLKGFISSQYKFFFFMFLSAKQ